MTAIQRPRRLVTLAALNALLAASTDASAGGGDRLDRALDRIVASRGGPPGVSVLIERGANREFRRRGVADLDARRRPTARDHMRLASVSKAYNGAVVLSLASAGELSLSDTVARRLPGVLPLAGPVTLSQALQHTSGLPEYIRTADFLERLRRDATAYVSPGELLGYIRDERLVFRPGSRYAYSDSDNIVAGVMAETATTRSYEELLAGAVYGPLGLRRTSLPRTVEMPEPYLHGYDVVQRGREPEDVSETINPAGAWASGGMVSTPLEVGRFMRAYVSGRLFDRASRRSQFRFRPGSSSPPGPGRNAAGLGLFRYRTRCGTVYGHTGSFPGYRMFAASSGNGRRSVVFAVNAQIVPGQGSRAVSNLIRQTQLLAVCRALR